MLESVELIASGYEWECPECEWLNLEIEITEIVTCMKCNKKFRVDNHYHAYE